MKYPKPFHQCMFISKKVEKRCHVHETVFLTGDTEPTSSFLSENWWRQEICKRQPEHWLDYSHAPIRNEPIGCRDTHGDLLNGSVVIRMDHMQAIRLPDSCLQHQIMEKIQSVHMALVAEHARTGGIKMEEPDRYPAIQMRGYVH